MSIFVHGGNRVFIGGGVELIPDEVAQAASTNHWAARSIEPNEANKWVLGKYVQADNANSNNQYWAHEQLVMAQPTIKNSPMNMLHQARRIVGSFVDTEMVYPTQTAAEAATNPYIEALGVFWRARFPEELAMVERAYDEGKLFFSMECVAEKVEIDLPDGRSEIFAYQGMQHETYGDFNDPAGVRKFIAPHFLGGALILPPAEPGWSAAEVEALAKYSDEHSDMVENVYANLAYDAPQLTESEVEQVALAYVSSAMQADSTEGLIKGDEVPNNNSENEEYIYTHSNGGVVNVSDTVKYSEADVTAAVEAAVTELKSQVEALTAAADADAREGELAEVGAKHDEAITELRNELDVATLKAEEASTERDEIVAWLTETTEAIEAAKVVEARREDRLAAVAEVATFDADYIEAHAGRWVEMSEEDFDAHLSDMAAVSKSAEEGEDDSDKEEVELATAMKHVSDEKGSTKTSALDVLADVISTRDDWKNTV